MKVLLLNSPELKLLTDAVRPTCTVVVTKTESSGSPGESQTAGWMPACTIEALLIRAETVTPILEEILRTRPPLYWVIDE